MKNDLNQRPVYRESWEREEGKTGKKIPAFKSQFWGARIILVPHALFLARVMMGAWELGGIKYRAPIRGTLDNIEMSTNKARRLV